MRIPALLGVQGLTADEQRAIYLFWTRVGRRWGIDLPEAHHSLNSLWPSGWWARLGLNQ